MTKIPRNKQDDYTAGIIKDRQDFIREQTGAELEHTARFSFDPDAVRGNIENFTGVVQMPLGLAGPMKLNGEHADGDFYVPMATTEGTLVASYNRGMRLTREAGGITVSVVDDAMQRAPVFIFENARQARDFGLWVTENFEAIKAQAETTTSVGKLRDIEQYSAARMLWLRFNFTTGDAAGQNMVTKAARAACMWILDVYPERIADFRLAANMDTDKKHSHLNTLRTRGKRVIAECVIPDALLREQMKAGADQFVRYRYLSSVGALLSASINNGSHSANGIASVFIATGQDEANVAESSAAIVYTDLTPDGDLYYSITIPSLIVASYGGGTGLPTQRECLEIMDCYGAGKAKKLAEIIGGVALCGELSLASAILADDWVHSHETYGRNRP